MRISNSRDLGRYVRDSRRSRGLTQAALASSANVSRRWLADLEAGKPTVEIGLVFQTLATLELVLDARPISSLLSHRDLDSHLRSVARNSQLGVTESSRVHRDGGRS